VGSDTRCDRHAVNSRLSDRTSATTFQEIAIRPPRNASYHVGDSLLLARIDRTGRVRRWGDVVVPVGIARVSSIEEQQVLAQSSRSSTAFMKTSSRCPLEPFRDPGQVRPTPVEQGLTGKLVAPRDPHPIAGAQQFFFIDKGRRDGVTLGDVFEVVKPAPRLRGIRFGRGARG